MTKSRVPTLALGLAAVAALCSSLLFVRSYAQQPATDSGQSGGQTMSPSSQAPSPSTGNTTAPTSQAPGAANSHTPGSTTSPYPTQT